MVVSVTLTMEVFVYLQWPVGSAGCSCPPPANELPMGRDSRSAGIEAQQFLSQRPRNEL